jgi:hypothetical protein
MGQVTIKQAAGIVRKRLQALQGAGQLPACLRFQVRATPGGKINITIDSYRDLIGTGQIDHEQARRWFETDGKQLEARVDTLTRDAFNPRPAGETKLGMLMLSASVTKVTRITMD